MICETTVGPIRVLALCGSRRLGSLNRAAVDAIIQLAASSRPVHAEVVHGPPLDTLPFFSDDLERTALPASIARLRADVGRADALLIAGPEYARGMSGMLKNALEWLVGSLEFPGKPVALLNVSPGYKGAERAQAWTVETLRTMDARLVEPAIRIGSAVPKFAGGSLSHPETLGQLSGLVDAIVQAVQSRELADADAEAG